MQLRDLADAKPRRSWSLGLGYYLVIASLFIGHSTTRGELLPVSDLFSNSTIVQLSIEIPPPQLQSLRREPRKEVPVTITEDQAVYTNVALHLKGALGSFQPVNAKPGMSINFAKLEREQRFHGLRKIMLNNSVQDPSCLFEYLTGDLFRQAGVPAPRTAHALVTLNGRKLGLYVLKQGFNKDFLQLNFKNPDGNFYDLNQGNYDLGTSNELKSRFRLDTGHKPADYSDLAALIQAAAERDPAQCWGKLGTVLDLERFISFMAMEAITCHVDGYSFYGHNFRLYNNPGTGFVFIPNDLDRMFENPGRPAIQAGFSAQAAAAVMRTSEGKRRYHERAAFLCASVFKLERLTNQVNLLQARIAPALAAWDPEEARQFEIHRKLVIQRLVRRNESLQQELKQVR